MDAWHSLVDSQRSSSINAFISQPAHARLAGQIAAVLDDGLFGGIPGEVVDVISRHDAGWAEPDLLAIEDEIWHTPISFLSVSPAIGVSAWRKSIASAEAVSPLAAALTRKHFWLLVPRDDHFAHQEFIEEQEACMQEQKRTGYLASDLARFTSALGFCDLLSLHLCSGSENCVRIPLAHPADLPSRNAEQVTVSVTNGDVQSNGRQCWRRGSTGVSGWLRSESNSLSRVDFRWRLA
jgi:hypothetical protein